MGKKLDNKMKIYQTNEPRQNANKDYSSPVSFKNKRRRLVVRDLSGTSRDVVRLSGFGPAKSVPNKSPICCVVSVSFRVPREEILHGKIRVITLAVKFKNSD